MVQQTFERKNVFKDFDLSMSQNPLTNDVSKKTDTNAITQSVKNLLNTSFYERPFRPTVGTNIRRILFEPADFITTSDLKVAINDTLINYEPRISIIETKITDLADKNSYYVSIYYKLINSQEVQEINVTLKRLR